MSMHAVAIRFVCVEVSTEAVTPSNRTTSGTINSDAGLRKAAGTVSIVAA